MLPEEEFVLLSMMRMMMMMMMMKDDEMRLLDRFCFCIITRTICFNEIGWDGRQEGQVYGAFDWSWKIPDLLFFFSFFFLGCKINSSCLVTA